MTQTYSLRKIPEKNIQINFEEENNDKIKILELMNIIDEWEKEVLFADNGFFSLKGKNHQRHHEPAQRTCSRRTFRRCSRPDA